MDSLPFLAQWLSISRPFPVAKTFSDFLKISSYLCVDLCSCVCLCCGGQKRESGVPELELQVDEDLESGAPELELQVVVICLT